MVTDDGRERFERFVGCRARSLASRARTARRTVRQAQRSDVVQGGPRDTGGTRGGLHGRTAAEQQTHKQARYTRHTQGTIRTTRSSIMGTLSPSIFQCRQVYTCRNDSLNQSRAS